MRKSRKYMILAKLDLEEVSSPAVKKVTIPRHVQMLAASRALFDFRLADEQRDRSGPLFFHRFFEFLVWQRMLSLQWLVRLFSRR